MKKPMKNLIAIIILALAAHSAWAMDIHSAKEQGLVGEARNGLLAAVKTPPSSEVSALIAEVNQKRTDRFNQVAQDTDATLEQVQYRFYQLAVQKTEKGHYYQDANGRWQRK